MILQKVQQIYTTQMLEQILEQHYVLNANLSALNDVNNATPTDGQVLTWDNAGHHLHSQQYQVVVHHTVTLMFQHI